jgi:hypothetical protein
MCFLSGNITLVVFLALETPAVSWVSRAIKNHSCDISTQKTHSCGFLILFQPPLGILTVLDEECLRPGNVTDLTFLEKLNHHHQFHEHYESRQCRKAQNDKTLPHDSFRIHHYAGLVSCCMSFPGLPTNMVLAYL